ncbi:MAG: trigger factor [Thiotrichaceae bacterium]|nr:trigger factor [Thiotrichaceae bacterium]PCI10873.1 MAG: trigger factor [Thiotrichales bacterium]PCI13348.1 MAG: trigger factor [Thiotrichales bacterium]
MQVSVEATGALERKMTVAVPAERVDQEVQKRLQSLSRTVNLPGFRPGKVPAKVVANKYGPKVRQEVMDEVTRSSFYEALTAEKLQPAGMPIFEPKPSTESDQIEFTATFEVYPDVELASFEGLSVERPAAEIAEKDIDAMIDKMRRQRVEWEEVDRAAKTEDQLVVDFIGSVDGEKFAGGEGDNVTLVLGSSSFIPGFEEQLVGRSKGEETTVSVTFPEDYQAAELAGKAAEFAVTVQLVSEAKLPEIDEAFAKNFGIESLDNLRGELSKSMQYELDQAIKGKTKQAVMDMLFEKNSIELPKSLVDEEINALMNQMKANLSKQGIPAEGLEMMDGKMYEDQARRRVTLSLLISEIVKSNDLKASPEKIRETVETVASTYDTPEEVVKWYYAERERLAQIESVVLEEMVVDWVLEKIQVEDQVTTFEALMARPKQ